MQDLIYADRDTVTSALPWPALIDAIAASFAGAFHAPDRHIHDVHVPGEPEATALLMPSWLEGDVYGVKLVGVFPGNAARGLPAVNGVYVLFSAVTGLPLAMMEGGVLTARRTAATSALASRFLSRTNSRTLALFATGRLAPMLLEAHAAVRPIERVLVWGRSPEKAARFAAAMDGRGGIRVEAVADGEAACAQADIVSCATLATAPIIRGDWLRAGTHVDLVGAFKPTMREADAAAVHRSQVFIDTQGGARAEAGDLIQAIAEGAFAWDAVRADLPALCRGTHPGRTEADAITLFKSVGCAIEDLAAAKLVQASIAGRE